LKENENEPAHEKREEQKAALEEEHYKLRQRANGTVKFIGELFKIDMLTSKIMRTCIEMLLQEPTEEKVRSAYSNQGSSANQRVLLLGRKGLQTLDDNRLENGAA
jgi:MIF4G domain